MSEYAELRATVPRCRSDRERVLGDRALAAESELEELRAWIADILGVCNDYDNDLCDWEDLGELRHKARAFLAVGVEPQETAEGSSRWPER